MRKTLTTARKKLDNIYSSEESYAEAFSKEVIKQIYFGKNLTPVTCVGEFVLLFELYPRDLTKVVPMSMVDLKKHFYSWLVSKDESFKSLSNEEWSRGTPKKIDIAVSNLVQNWGIDTITINGIHDKICLLNGDNKLHTIKLEEDFK